MKKLVFDIGMHTGQDSINYLKDGFKVIAVEANPLLVDENKKKFKKYIEDNSLVILNIGISDKEGALPFYINKKTSEWSSFDFAHGSRNNTPYEVKNIPCVTTATLFEKYGIPHLLKVDIEGYDYLCINDLPATSTGNAVKYISCEGSDVSLIDTMYKKGYTKFKLIHQAFNFNPIDLKLERNPLFPKFLLIYNGLRLRLDKLLGSKYPYSSSGPMPEKSKGEWLSYEKVRQLFTDFEKMKLPDNRSWFDIHATF